MLFTVLKGNIDVTLYLILVLLTLYFLLVENVFVKVSKSLVDLLFIDGCLLPLPAIGLEVFYFSIYIVLK